MPGTLQNTLLPALTAVVASLSAIPEQERQRLSHASRLKLDNAETELRRLLKALARGDE